MVFEPLGSSTIVKRPAQFSHECVRVLHKQAHQPRSRNLIALHPGPHSVFHSCPRACRPDRKTAAFKDLGGSAVWDAESPKTAFFMLQPGTAAV